MTDVVICAAARTAVGSFNGAFAQTPAHVLGAEVIKALLSRANLTADAVNEIILGQVLTAAQGQNPARQAAMLAGIPKEVPSWGVNQVCGSGLRAVALGAQAILTGEASVVIAGGQESMSLAPHAGLLRPGQKMGTMSFLDTMITDGLWDAFNDYHMGITAENIAEKWGVSREAQDAFAVASQNKAEAAQTAGSFRDEIVPVTLKGRKGDVVIAADEYIRPGTTLESVAKIRPAFKKDGTVTAANASGLNDGAAAVLLMSAQAAKEQGVPVLARIASFASCGVDPAFMGIAPVYASRLALQKAGWTLADVDLIEANEAFAAQSLAVGQELGWDPAKVNVNGGAIAIGHPIGASGARVLVTLLHAMARRNVRRGLATLCIGGGMGVAMCVERSA